jgi:hypothetical protein
VTFSSDKGETWTTPQKILNSTLSQRHPALVQVDEKEYLLFFLGFDIVLEDYRIYRASSSDGITWKDHGMIDLGWADKGEINPCVIREADGTLTMTYHRYHGPSYIAQSTDNGVIWDRKKTQVSNSNGALPRLAKRESDGCYLVTYQTGGSTCYVWAKTTIDPYTWPQTATPLSTTANSHDSQPIVLEGGTFLVTYARADVGYFDIHYKTSYDGLNWSDKVQVTSEPSRYDTQPHPLLHGTPGHLILTWSHQEGATPYVDHDVMIDTDLVIPLPFWLDSDSLSASTGGTVNLALDAGAEKAYRNYLVLGSASGTDPGIPLPGGEATLPVNWDPFTEFVVALLNTPVFLNFLGTLDGEGKATAQINTGGPLNPQFAGITLYFAFCLDYPWEFVSNPLAIEIVP